MHGLPLQVMTIVSDVQESAQHTTSGFVIAYRCDVYKYLLPTGFCCVQISRRTLKTCESSVVGLCVRTQCFELNIDIVMQLCARAGVGAKVVSRLGEM